MAPPWRVAFDEAWTSWVDGNFGIGAVLVNPATGDTVATGRNRVAQRTSEPGLLTGNMTAHAEMNAFAAMDRFDAEGLHLYSTLEPCLMCAATAMQLKVAHVSFAAADEFFTGLEQLWQHHPVTNGRQYASAGPLVGEHAQLASFARLLPMTFTIEHFEGRAAETLARETHPELVDVAEELLRRRRSGQLASITSAAAAMDELGPLLPPS